MAIGIALLIGFAIPPNFNLPYLAHSPIDFWRRWHISLSSWLRDYLYIGLGGNRRHRYRNLMLTMLLGGLWHGARWTFVAWGAYHGLLLVLWHVCGTRWPYLATVHIVARALGCIVTFYLIVIGWVLFRADTLSQTLDILRDMHQPSGTAIAAEQWRALLVVIAALVLGHAISALQRPAFDKTPLRWMFWPAVVVLFATGIVLASAGRVFLYFVF
jgi:D-alanyl-lipoteichoic acid acyltransferase DltB (MBOAT superfamily)